MYKIGEFSKLVDISIKTLRYYDELKILSPKIIDNYTGYRYYNDDSILECELIKLLKSVGFTLDEIKAYKDNVNSDILITKQKEVQDEIDFLKKRYNRLQKMINMSKEEKIEPKIYRKYEIDSNEDIDLRRKNEKRNFRKND
jgi:DNA-binding transcriptional MerR regulator